MLTTIIALALLVAVFTVLLIVGVPIAISLSLASLLPLVVFYVPDASSLMSAAQTLLTGMNKSNLLGIVLFILSGSIMNETGLARRLINLAKLIGGGVPGSIAHINVVSNMLFGALSGSAVAAASTIGKVITPIAEEEGYKKEFIAAVNIASSPLGFLIPPSGSYIIYSILTDGAASIAALFLAGYVPGILMGLAIMVVSFFVAKKEKYGTSKINSLKETIKILIEGIPVLLLIFLIIGGIIFGIFTAVEAAGIAAFYSCILAVIYRSISLQKFWAIVKDTAIISASILFLISASSVMSWLFSYSRIPVLISEALLSISTNKYVILMIMNAILFVMGMFMDIGPIGVIFTPIFFPIAYKMGVDPVHFGIILTANAAIGVCTPPVGSALFVGSNIAGARVEKIIPWLIPMIIGQVVAVTIITFWEDGILFVPRLFGLI